MTIKLFHNVNSLTDPQWLIKGFFNYIAETGEFLQYIEALSRRESVGIDEEHCVFPEPWEQEADRPYVSIHTFGERIIYPEKQFWDFYRFACMEYARQCPADANRITAALSQLGSFEGTPSSGSPERH